MKRYQVLTYTICDGWINCWHETDAAGNEELQTFATRAEAEAEIMEHLAEQRAQVSTGERDEDQCDAFEDFQIEETEVPA